MQNMSIAVFLPKIARIQVASISRTQMNKEQNGLASPFHVQFTYFLCLLRADDLLLLIQMPVFHFNTSHLSGLEQLRQFFHELSFLLFYIRSSFEILGTV